jgi:hypothetical protein
MKRVGYAVVLVAMVITSSSIATDESSSTLINGDVNCDGEVDISDAIFVLVYLFSGTGEPPCPLADRPELIARVTELEAELALKGAEISARDAIIAQRDAEISMKNAELESKDALITSCQADKVDLEVRLAEAQTEIEACRAELSRVPRLPATCQTKCYAVGTEIDCVSADFPGQDGFYQAGCPTEGRFVDNGDGTITDTCTGLMWQKATADVNGDGEINSSADRLNWQDALKYCENLIFAGHDDWRLPNIRELESIVDHSRWDPAIDPVFEATSEDWYWSSTSGAAYPNYAWHAHFYDGVVYVDQNKISRYFVRAVRSGL